MISKINLEHVLFLDIETVPEFEDFSALTAEKKALWKQKSKYQRKDEYTAEEFYPRAGIWAEFGKIICISVLFRVRFTLKSISNHLILWRRKRNFESIQFTN